MSVATLQVVTMVSMTVSQLVLVIAVTVWSMATLKGLKVTENMITAFNDMDAAFKHMVEAFDSQQDSLEKVVEWTVPPEEWADTIELRNHLIANGSQLGDYLIYCQKNGGFWALGDDGYTPDKKRAKRFSAAEGLLLVLDRARNGDPYDCYTLIRVGKVRPVVEAAEETAAA